MANGEGSKGYSDYEYVAAQCIVYVCKKLDKDAPSWAQKFADNPYTGNPGIRDTKCSFYLIKIMSQLTADQESSIVYNARNKTARALADWWEDHQEVQKEFNEKIQMELKRSQIKKVALSKLTKEEKEALDI